MVELAEIPTSQADPPPVADTDNRTVHALAILRKSRKVTDDMRHSRVISRPLYRKCVDLLSAGIACEHWRAVGSDADPRLRSVELQESR
jgi:hypothetical protein